jgi:hypothetical protein
MKEWDIAIERAIKALGDSFDSHRLIQEVAHRNQRQYVAALAVIESDTPFHKLHSALGRRIKIVGNRLGFTSEDSRSPDMFGQYSKCLRWSRYFNTGAEITA